MMRLWKTLQQRTPLGLLQLKHDPIRLLTAIAGITFADILIFMQLGFADARDKSNTQYPRVLVSDLRLISSEAKDFGQLRSFTRRSLYQALDVPVVVTAEALYLGSVTWRNPQTDKEASMLLIGQNPERPAFELPVVNEQIGRASCRERV